MKEDLSPEFWESADGKWRFWKDLEISLSEIQPLMIDDLDGVISVMHAILDLFRLLDPKQFVNSHKGRNRTLSIIATFIMEQVNGHAEID